MTDNTQTKKSKTYLQSGEGIDFVQVNNKKNFILTDQEKRLYFKANEKSNILKDNLDMPKATETMKDKCDPVRIKNEVAIELPIHEMKRLLDEMTVYRDYLKEVLSKEHLAIVDTTEETEVLEEVEKMIEGLVKNIKDEGYDHVSMKLLDPTLGIKPELLKSEDQGKLAENLKAKLEEIESNKKIHENCQNLENETEFELVSQGTEAEFKMISKLDLMNKKLDDILSFIGDESTHLNDPNNKTLVEEVSHWYKSASILDRYGIKDVQKRLQFVDKELDNVTKEKRMIYFTGEQRQNLEHNLENTPQPEQMKSEIYQLMTKMEETAPNVELLATISLDVNRLKERVEEATADRKDHKELLESLAENIEANQAILEKNLSSFEERIKKLSS